MIDIREGDFVQTVLLNELIKKREGRWNDGGSLQTKAGFYLASTCEVMKNECLYRVSKVNRKKNEISVYIDGSEFIFNCSDIKHVYRISLKKIM